MAKDMGISRELGKSREMGAQKEMAIVREMAAPRKLMKAIVVTDQAAGTAGMKLVERPKPQDARALSGANYGDVVVQVHASGFTGDELSWPSTWIDRLGRDRTPSIPGHELAEWSRPSAMERRGCRWVSGCSASRTGLATARWRSM